jgi:lipoyl(octanoyl) transferase
MIFFRLKTPVAYKDYLDFQMKVRKTRKESILILEHFPTITAGINFKAENLLLSESLLSKKNIPLHYISRGGDFTAHEIGQIVIYPHIDLKKREIKVSDFIHFFKESISASIEKVWNIQLVYNMDNPGLYLKNSPKNKLVSFGVYFKSFFTSFGAAINFTNSLETFLYINPCGGLSADMVSLQSLNADTSKKELFLNSFQQNLYSALKL